MSTPADNSAPKKPANALYRSRTEICRILEAVVKDGTALSASLPGGNIFVSRILLLEQDLGYLVISYGANKELNKKVLEFPALQFTASHQGAYIEFTLSNPAETQFNGTLAIQCALPVSLILGNRREHPRIPVPAEISLRCIADEQGFAPFESHICDISHEGMGGLIYDPDINLEPGTVLKGCRIIIPGGIAVVADLEVRNTRIITLPDGTLANRIGFRLIRKPDELTELINYFIQDLDKS